MRARTAFNRIILIVVAILSTLMLAACGDKEERPTVPAGAQAGDLAGQESCTYEANNWHQPWTIPGAIAANAIFFALPARFFRSTWMSIIAHSMQYLLSIPLIQAVVLGLA